MATLTNNTSGESPENQAISEVLWFWAALFDGPPSSEMGNTLNEDIWPLMQALTPHPLPPVAAGESLAQEYEEWLLIPYGDSPTSLYDEGAPDTNADTFNLWILAAILELPWQKETFAPNRAYPVRPDHLSVLLALWAILVTIPLDADLGGQTAEAWQNEVTHSTLRILDRLSEALPPETTYHGLAVAAADYAHQVQQWQAQGR